MDKENIIYFLSLIDTLRDTGYFERADILREMMRRMGYEVRNEKDGRSTAKLVWKGAKWKPL